MNLTRRDFIAAGSSAVVGAALATPAAALPTPAQNPSGRHTISR